MVWRLHGPKEPKIPMVCSGVEPRNVENIIKPWYVLYSWCLKRVPETDPSQRLACKLALLEFFFVRIVAFPSTPQ